MDTEQRIKLIEHRLTNAFTPSVLRVIDDSHEHVGHAGSRDGAGHYTVEIMSELFASLTLVSVHRQIYDVLMDLIPSEIHALRIKVIKE